MKRKSKWKLLLGMALVVLFTLMMVTGALASQYGSLTETIDWQLDDNGVMTITGKGAIPDYTQGNAPWYASRNDIVKVLFYGDITQIGDCSFSDCINLAQVAFSDETQIIGERAFYGCTALSKSEVATQSWEVPTYEWSADYSRLTATRKSNLNPSNIQTETVNSVYEEIQAPSCEETGSGRYTAGGFQNSAFIEQIKDVEIAAPGHTPEIDEAVEPTCIEPGKTEGQHCAVCGAILVEQETIPVKSHTISKVERKEPTCTEAGNIECWHCSFCEKYFSDEEGTTEIGDDDRIIPANGHTMTKTEAHEATCTTTGNTEYWYCSVCEKYFEDEEGTKEINEGSWAIPAAHSLEFTEAKTPTCMTAGNVAYWYCSKCEKYFSDENAENEITAESTVIAIDPDAHEWGETSYTWNDDYSKVTAKRVCSRNHEHIETETADFDTVVTTEPDCENAGSIKYISKAFENTAFSVQTKIVEGGAALDHDWGEVKYIWADDNKSVTAKRVCKRNESHVEQETAQTIEEVLVAPTCTEEGLSNYSATFENAAFEPQRKENVVTAPAGHAWGKVTYTWSSDNSTVTAKRVCANDASHVETETVAATYKVTKEATTKADGTGVYTSKAFENKAFAVQKKTVAIKKYPATYKDKYCAYKISDKLTATVTGPAKKSLTSIVVPDTITVQGKTMKVIGIEDKAFKGNTKVKSISIGKNVTSIGKNAFLKCTKLKTVTGMDGVTTIGESAFQGNTALTEITITSKVKKIGKNAFNGDKKLKKITIKTTKLTASNVGADAFKGIYNKVTIKCPSSKLKAYKKFLLKKGVTDKAEFKK